MKQNKCKGKENNQTTQYFTVVYSLSYMAEQKQEIVTEEPNL